MAQPTNVYSVYGASGSTGVGKGNREDLVDAVYDISPTETPILTALRRGKASAVLHEWTTHSLAAAAANEKVEGDDGVITAAIAKVRLNNRCAISNKVAGVTKTQQVVDKVGAQDALAEEVGYKMAEIKRDMELMLHANTAKVAGNDTTARKTAGAPTWLKDNVSNIGANPTGDGSDTATDGAQRAFTEDMLLAVSQSCYVNGGKPTLLDVGAFNKRAVSGFPANVTRHVTASEQTLINSIDVYEDDFNKLKVVPNRFALARNAILWDLDNAKIAYLRAFDTWDLAVTGSSLRKEIEVEWALEMCNPAAHGIVRDLTTSPDDWGALAS
jgi:hypothetical protein